MPMPNKILLQLYYTILSIYFNYIFPVTCIANGNLEYWHNAFINYYYFMCVQTFGQLIGLLMRWIKILLVVIKNSGCPLPVHLKIIDKTTSMTNILHYIQYPRRFLVHSSWLRTSTIISAMKQKSLSSIEPAKMSGIGKTPDPKSPIQNCHEHKCQTY